MFCEPRHCKLGEPPRGEATKLAFEAFKLLVDGRVDIFRPCEVAAGDDRRNLFRRPSRIEWRRRACENVGSRPCLYRTAVSDAERTGGILAGKLPHLGSRDAGLFECRYFAMQANPGDSKWLLDIRSQAQRNAGVPEGERQVELAFGGLSSVAKIIPAEIAKNRQSVNRMPDTS